MHDQVHEIPTADGAEPVRVLFNHAALFRLEREFDLTPMRIVRQLEELSAVTTEAMLLVGLEGFRARGGGREKAWTAADVRALLDGSLSGLGYGDLSKQLLVALDRALRRGKAAPPPATPPTQ